MKNTSIMAECTSNVYLRWGTVADPKDLVVGKKYEVDHCVIHGSYTQVYLVGDPHAYNSCNFNFFDGEGKEIDIVDYFNHECGTHICKL